MHEGCIHKAERGEYMGLKERRNKDEWGRLNQYFIEKTPKH